MSAPVYPIKILAALHKVMSEVGYVQKKGRNDFHKYNYAGEGNLLEVLRPAMVEAGLILIPSHKTTTAVDDFGNIFVTVEYTLAHKDGDVWPEKIVVYGAGNDKNKSGGVGDKGLYKALTGANKYLLFKLFQIETGDDPEKDADHEKEDAAPKVKRPAGAPWTIKAKSPEAFVEAFLDKIAKAPTLEAADKLHTDNKANLTSLSDEQYKACAEAYDRRVAAVSNTPAVAAE